MGGCSSVGRLVLVILNMLFLLIALGLLAVGGILKYMPGKLMGFLLQGAQSAIPSPTGPGGVTLPSNTIPDTLDFVPMVDDFATVLLALGGVLFCISFLACCGACYKWRPLLILFAIVMILIILAIAVVGALFLVKDSVLHDTIRSSLAEKTEKEYAKDKSGPFIQIANVLALQMKCCGFTGPSDFVHNLTAEFKDLPPTCCVNMDQACIMNMDLNLIETTGCYDKLQDMIEGAKTYAIVGLVGVLLLLLLEVIFAIVIVADIGGNKVGQS